MDTPLAAERVIRALELLIDWRGGPKQIHMDNGTELISARLKSWTEEHQIFLVHNQPGKPSRNAYDERFNLTFWEYFLDANSLIL